MSKTDLNSRLYLVSLVFILIFSVLIARLIYVQVIKSAQLKAYARGQHNIYREISPLRGEIFDRNLQQLAVNRIFYSVFVTNEFLTNEEKSGKSVSAEDQQRLQKLASLLNLEAEDLKAKLNPLKNFIWLDRKITPEVSAKIRKLNLLGVGQIRENKRSYPNGSFACHILGFTDVDNKGLEGVELSCDSYLSGVKGWRLAQRDAKRREVICWGYQSILPADGYDAVLTIDNVIQNIVERQLRQAVRKYKATSATAIVLRPQTSEILAMYNYPNYDLNNFADYPAQARRNLAITDVFEPGSSFKFVTAAAALEENKVKLEDRFFCENGNLRLGKRVLHDYKPYGELSFKEVVEHSSNIGMAKIAQLLGPQSLYTYVKKFGFGELTGIELPGEVRGIARPPEQWSSASIYSIPMGQEVAVTALQLINAMSCLANDGVLMKPMILKEIKRKDGQGIKIYQPEMMQRVVSSETAQKLKQILVGVVENGTGKNAKVPGYATAGKTGTAQKANSAGGYFKNKYCSSFVGFVPADKPAIAVLVVLNEPYPQYFGGTVCAPVFRDIATETLRYLEISGQ